MAQSRSSHLGFASLLLCFFLPNKGLALDLLGKPTNQSSTYYVADDDAYLTAALAVDGDRTTISHTLCTSGDHWWRVDLEALYRVTKVTIVNRADRFRYRLEGAKVRAGLYSEHSQNGMIGSRVTGIQARSGADLNFVSHPSITARYVSVELSGTCLHVAEVMVEGEAVISTGELVDFTCFNKNPVLSFDTDSTYIGGYKGSPALTNAAVSFGRTFETATGSGLPTSCSCIPAATGQGTLIMRQYMNCPSGACSCSGSNPTCLYRIGAFYCQIDTGTTVEKITTITLNSDAEIIPERQTITVSRGEAVTLRVATTLSPSPDWRWRRTSYTFNNWLHNWDGINSPYLSQVTPADGGVYECHSPGMRGRGVHAIFRLIVRDCANDTWGTGCVNECPVCYNGGVCHDSTGKCICAPGFSGSNCQIANGRNVWGYGGTLRCLQAEGRHGTSCMGRLFCLQDPFGCACAAGYKGIRCDQECDEPNTFGPYCSQTCHCADNITCLIDTGECNDPLCNDDLYCPQHCASGWKGRNCQVVTPCMPGHYGELCNQRCNCRDDQPCSEDTGQCTNGCAEGYVGASCNEDGSIAITYIWQTDKPNAGQPVTIQCEVVGNPLPDATDVILQGPDAQQYPFVNSSESTELNAYMRTNEYILTGESASDGIQLTCYVNLGSTPYGHFTVDVYELPYLASAPTSSATDSMSITVSWDPWTSTQGRGDGPIVRYDVQYRLKSDDDINTLYNFVISPAYNTSTSVVVPGLQIDTEYDFVIVVVREGEGGAGPPSSKTTLGTTCSTPTEAPSIMLTTESGTELRLTWQYPAQSTWQCRSLRDIQVYIKEGSASRYPSQPLVYNSDETEAVLGSLEPCTRYEGYITFNNRDGFDSPMSNTVGATTAETAPGRVNGFSVFEVSGSPYDQLGVVWRAPTENSCPVDGYIISHTLKNLYACTSGITPVTHSRTVSSAVTTVSLNDLKAYSYYSVSVVAMNSEGNSTARVQSTSRSSAVSSFIPTVTVQESDIAATSIQFTWNEVPCEECNGWPVSYNTILTNLATDADESSNTGNSEESLEEGLTPCTAYSFQVAVENSKGTGTYSNATEVTTRAVVPDQVGSLSAEAVDGYPTILRVSWNKPTGNCPIIRYTIGYELVRKLRCEYVSRSRNVSGTTIDTMYNVTGLLPYSAYYVYVKATTSAGDGTDSEDWARTAEAAPTEPPMSVTNSAAGKRDLYYEWQPPSCLGRGGDIIGYSYILVDLERDVENITGDTNADTRYADISGLVPYTMYSFQVLARTSAGDGPYSDAVKMRTDQAKPLAVPSVTTPSADATSVTVQWLRPDPPHGIIVAYYVLYFVVTKEESNQTVKVTEDLEQPIMRLQLTGLEADSNYSIQVQAETVRKGPFSRPVYRITQEGTPGAPSSLMIDSKTQTKLTIVWDEPDEPNGRIVSYTVKYQTKYKPYDPDFNPSSVYTTSPLPNPDVRSHDIIGLDPGTKYEIMVYASTREGEGAPAMFEGFTKPASDIPPPDKPTVDPDTSTGTSVVISIPVVDNRYIVSYLVIVKKVSTRKRRQSVLYAQDEEFGSFDNNPNSYVAAEIDKKDHTGNFVIGDNRTYSGYYNPPLQEGAMYEIQTGSSSKTDDAPVVSWSPPLTVQAGKYDSEAGPDAGGEGGGGGAGTGTGTGTIVAVILVILFAGVVAFGAVYMIRRKRGQQTAKPFDSVGMQQVDKSKYAAKKPVPAPKLKHVPSEDAMTNLNTDMAPRNGASRTTPVGAVTLPADVHHKPTVKASGKMPSSGPVTVENLSEYVKGKKAKNNEGFKQDYGGLPNGQSHSWDIARNDENKVKNRYANIIAYDHSRVILDKLESDPHSDYINASYIDGYKHPKKYIASQGPNIASTRDMWRMIWQEQSSIIVMVTHLVEGGKKKCEQYWPSTSKRYSNIEVSLETETTLSDYIIRTFILEKMEETRKLTQYHFTSWPDMGLPLYVSPLLNFVGVVREGSSCAPDMGPIIVHCSAGVGRTGTFITIDAMLDQAKAEGQVDVLQFVTSMRESRVRMVQTQEQYVFIFDALLELFLIGKTGIPVDDLRKAFDRLKTPSPTGNSTVLHEEFSKLTKFHAPSKGDRSRGGKDALNMNKNRFPDKVPLDRGRPYLMTMGTEQSTNYINASFINGYWKRDQYIITQIPMPNTTTDFWSMVYDYNSSTIVMLNQLDPKDETMDKYWPEKTLSAYGPYTVNLISMEAYDGIVCRTFTIDNMNKPKDEAHTVRQFEFQGWPMDTDVPSSTMALLKLIRYLERWLEETNDGPITVQCIDGVRCSGVFCAILSMLDGMKTEMTVDVFQAVKRVRNNRPSGVSTLEQYKLCYETALMHLESFDIYENFR